MKNATLGVFILTVSAIALVASFAFFQNVDSGQPAVPGEWTYPPPTAFPPAFDQDTTFVYLNLQDRKPTLRGTIHEH